MVRVAGLRVNDENPRYVALCLVVAILGERVAYRREVNDRRGFPTTLLLNVERCCPAVWLRGAEVAARRPRSETRNKS